MKRVGYRRWEPAGSFWETPCSGRPGDDGISPGAIFRSCTYSRTVRSAILHPAIGGIRERSIRICQRSAVSLPPASVAKDGTFRLDAVHHRQLSERVTQLPENAFLERIFLDDVPADEEVDLTRGVKGSQLRIVVNRRGGQLSGKIVDTEGQAEQTPSLVHLMAEGKVKYATGVSGGNKFVIQGIRPGKYRLLAIDRLDQFQFQGTEGLKALAGEAPEIEIREGDLIVRNLTLMRKDRSLHGDLDL